MPITMKMQNMRQPMSISKTGGTPSAGYMGPEDGPYECDNCTHFDEGASTCNQPNLLQDIPGGKVDPEGCCNYFESGHRETNEEEHREGPDQDQSRETGIGRGLAGLT